MATPLEIPDCLIEAGRKRARVLDQLRNPHPDDGPGRLKRRRTDVRQRTQAIEFILNGWLDGLTSVEITAIAESARSTLAPAIVKQLTTDRAIAYHYALTIIQGV